MGAKIMMRQTFSRNHGAFYKLGMLLVDFSGLESPHDVP
jgi:hypothetical protein